MEFGDRLKAARKAAGLTQEELSKLSGVKQSSIANYETNTRENPNKENVKKISKVLKKEYNWLLYGIEKKYRFVDDFIESLHSYGCIGEDMQMDKDIEDAIMKVVEAEIILLNRDKKLKEGN